MSLQNILREISNDADKIADKETRALIVRLLTGASQGRLWSVEDSAIGRVLGQGCADIETLMPPRPIDRV